MSNRIFLDSSILVEDAEGTRKELLTYLVEHIDRYEICVSETVLSEFTYFLLAIEGEKAPRTLKQNGRIPGILSKALPEILLSRFTVLPNTNALIPEYLRLMTTYNLLPNDALILATCLRHGIRQVASYDEPDFGPACRDEDLQLVRIPEDLLT